MDIKKEKIQSWAVKNEAHNNNKKNKRKKNRLYILNF